MTKKVTKLVNLYYFKVGQMYVEHATGMGSKVTLTKRFDEAWKYEEDLLYDQETIEREGFSEMLRHEKEGLVKYLLSYEERIRKAGLDSTLHRKKIEQAEEVTDLEWVSNHALELELRPKSE